MEASITSRKQVIEQAAQNLIEAQIAKPEEYDKVISALFQLDPKDLLTALLESWKFRAECKQPIKFCPITLPIVTN